MVETAEKGKINFITDMIYQRANEHDYKIHEKLREANEQKGLKPEKLYADSSYISGIEINNYRKRNQELMGYVQLDSCKKDEDFKLDNFDIDPVKLEATCPTGKVSANTSINKNGDINIYFSRSVCKECRFFEKCVGNNTKQIKRRLHLKPDYKHIRERRVEQKTEAFKKEMSVRAQVEGTISEAVRFLGLRNAKYKGEDGHQYQFYLTAAALNVKRLMKAMVNGRDVVRAATS